MTNLVSVSKLNNEQLIIIQHLDINNNAFTLNTFFDEDIDMLI